MSIVDTNVDLDSNGPWALEQFYHPDTVAGRIEHASTDYFLDTNLDLDNIGQVVWVASIRYCTPSVYRKCPNIRDTNWDLDSIGPLARVR